MIPKLNFGFLGEIYVEPEVLYGVDEDVIHKYFSKKSPYFASRNAYYYQTNIEVLRGYLYEYPIDLNEILDLKNSRRNKKLLLFTVLSHILNDTSKLIGIVFSYENLRIYYLNQLKTVLDQLCSCLIDLLFFDKIIDIRNLNLDSLYTVIESIIELDNIVLREYTEMDHMKILIQSFFVYQKHIVGTELIMGILQGGCIIPAIYKSMYHKLIKSGEDLSIEYDYIRYSNYDTHQFMSKGPEQYAKDIAKKFNPNTKIMIIDDNAGTGSTINKLKGILSTYFKNIHTCVVECRWDTKINDPTYPAFSINSIDIITPLEYRHYGYFDEKMLYIKLSDEIHDDYKKGMFYKLEFIYDLIDFDEFITKSEITKQNKKQLTSIISDYKLFNN